MGKVLDEAKAFTEEKMGSLRKQLADALEKSKYKHDICVVTTGSYGRQEASSESDMDWYIIFDKDREAKETIPKEISAIENVIGEVIPKRPGDTGTFGPGSIASFSEMQQNIGGKCDTNSTLTRRMLFLLEGDWLSNPDAFKDYRKSLLKKYIKQTDSQSNISMFLLNDVIRYYRTITTDFEYKVSEESKDWGLRNIKLRFSRKLIYFGGIIVAAELHNLDYQGRLMRAEELFGLPPLERICSVCDDETVSPLYEQFLEKIGDPESRERLKNVTKKGHREDDLYRDLSELSIEFSRKLHDVLREKYCVDQHPIHHALIF